MRDKKAPEITLNGDAEMTVEAGSKFSDPGYTATDNYDGDLTDKVSVTGAVDTSKLGDYEIKYSVADSSKNESDVKRTVHVTDTTAPQIKLSGDDFMSVKKGDKLLEVDINSIHEKGYSLETPVLVTNADDYADVIEMASGSVKAGAPLLTALNKGGYRREHISKG